MKTFLFCILNVILYAYTSKLRVDLYNEYSPLVSNNNIKFDEDSQGESCITVNDLKHRQFVFKIPKEYIMCSYDPFPFKREIFDLLRRFRLINPVSEENETTFLFALYLMLIQHENKVNHFLTRYLNSFQDDPITEYELDLNEIQLARQLGLEYKYTYTVELHKFVIQNLSKIPDVDSSYLEALSDVKLFSRLSSVIKEKSFRINSKYYSSLHSLDINLLNPFEIAPCLIPFLDLCTTIKPYMKNKRENNLIFWKGNFVFVKLDETLKAGSRLRYNYMINKQASGIISEYDLIKEQSNESVYQINIKVDSSPFVAYKGDACIILKCYKRRNVDLVYELNKNWIVNKVLLSNTGVLPERFLYFLKIYFFEFCTASPDFYVKRLTKGMRLTYISDIKAYTLLRQNIVAHLDTGSSNLDQRDLLNFLHLDDKLKITTKEIFIQRLKLDSLLYANVKAMNKKIKVLMAEQLLKLRRYFNYNISSPLD